LLLLAVVGLAFGAGGPEFSAAFPNLDDLNRRLAEVSLEFGGAVAPQREQPVLALGGHSLRHIGAVTIGGRGAVSASRADGDVVVSDLMLAWGTFEVGYPWSTAEFYWLRPCAEVQAGAWLDLVHSPQALLGDALHRRWFAGWSVGVVPSLEAMVRLRYLGTSYIGVYGSAGYAFTLVPAQYYGHRDPPDFDLSGFVLRAGLRFGSLTERDFHF
jgi:hypothetical protein